jgi:hypothetical protein
VEGRVRVGGDRVGVSSHGVDLLRRRLATSERPRRIFEVVGQVVAETGVLAGKTRRELDSTVLDDAVATQDTVTQLIAAIRRVARVVPGAAAVVAEHCCAHDYRDPGKPGIAWDDANARARLVDMLLSDAHRLLGHLPEQELGSAAAEAVVLLALVAGQDVEPAEGSDGTDGRWRIARKVTPERVISTVDPEARHAHKTRARHQDGYTAHVKVEPDTGLITGCALTPAAGPVALRRRGRHRAAGRRTRPDRGESAFSGGSPSPCSFVSSALPVSRPRLPRSHCSSSATSPAPCLSCAPRPC